MDIGAAIISGYLEVDLSTIVEPKIFIKCGAS